MEEYLPYIGTILCSLVSGFTSYFASRRQAKAELQKLQKQHDLDLKAEREKFEMEKEKMELDHKYQLELKQKEIENQFGADFATTVLVEALKIPELRQQFVQGARNNGKKNK